MQNRSFSVGGKYRYGFNGKEKDNDIAPDNYDFGARIYDARLGRWLAVDPHYYKYVSFSPYNYCMNTPTKIIDKNGKDGELSGSGTEDDPYIIKATYAYVKGTLDVHQLSSLQSAINQYNKKGFEVKTETGQVVHIRYQLNIVELPEGTELSNEVKGDLRKDPKYSFTDENGKFRSSLNFIHIGNTANCGNHEDAYGCAVGNKDIYLNKDEFDKTEKEVTDVIYEQKKNSCIPFQDKSEIMKSIMTSVFIHEIYHNLGGKHADIWKKKIVPEMVNMTTGKESKSINSNGGCSVEFDYNVISPSKEGAANLIHKITENNSNPDSGFVYRRKQD